MLRKKALIESTGASMRLSGKNITNEQVEEILNKFLDMKKVERLGEGGERKI